MRLLKIKSHLSFIILIIIISISVWYKTMDQSFLGEGFYYFDSGQDLITKKGINYESLIQLDNFARVIFDVLPPFFKDNISAYFAFQIFVITLLYITLYYVLHFITKNKLLSLSATVLFLASYVGSFEMIGVGNYQRFAQRVPNIIPTLLSLMLLARYLENKKLKYCLLALVVFSFSIFIAHFSTFLLPFFVIYILVWTLFEKINLFNISRNLLIALSFVIVNNFIISQDVHTPHTSFVNFISQKGIYQITEQILLQHANIILPTFLIDKIASIGNPYTTTLILASLPAIPLYIYTLIYIIKKEPKFKTLYISSLLVIPVLLFLNLYLGKVDPSYNIKGYTYYFIPSFYSGEISNNLQIKGDRAYMIPSIFIAVVWSYVIWAFFASKKRLYILLTVLILSTYILYNIDLINSNIYTLQFNSKIMKDYISYTKSISNQFDNRTIIVTPQPLIWTGSFIRSFYGSPELKFISANITWEEEIKNQDKNYIFLLDYDYRNKKVIDLTSKYRSGEKVIFQGY